MVNRNYQKGRRYEYKIKHFLENRGWIAFRTAGSHGVADIIAVKEGHTLLIQCKYDCNVSTKELSKMRELVETLDPDYDSNILILIAKAEPRVKTQFMEVQRNGALFAIKESWFGNKID